MLGLPLVSVVVAGPKSSKRMQLIFDSGAFMTQLNRNTLSSIGFTFAGRATDLFIKGVTGPKQSGYSLPVSRVFVLGKKFSDVAVGAFDFTEWVNQGIDGLLGWDLIEKLHFEMNGPLGILKIL